MRNSFVSWLTAATIVFGVLRRGCERGNRAKRHANMRNRMEAGSDGGNDRWRGVAAVSGAVPNAPRLSRRADGRTRAGPAVRLPVPMVAAVGDNFHRGFKCPTGGQSVMRLCASQWKDAKAAGTTGGQTWPQFLSQCRTRQSSTASSSGGFAPAPAPAPAPASQSGSLFPWWQQSAPASASKRRAFGPAGGPIYDGARRPCPMPIGHRRVGQHADAHLSLFGNPLLRANPQGAYMCEADARAAGYRASRNRQREAEAHSG